MDDKPSELASLQETVLKTLETFSTLIEDLAKQIRESNELKQARLKQELAHLNSIPAQSTTYLAGQFRRRDGDGYGTIPRKIGTVDDANHKTGDL